MRIKTIFLSLLVLSVAVYYINLEYQKRKTLSMYADYIKGYTSKKEKLEQLHNNHNFKIIMIGDSITAGNNWNKSFNRNDILNMGQGADVTDITIIDKKFGIINRLDGLDNLYKKAFLMIGINDILSKSKTTKKIFDNYIKIISIVQDNNITPIIQSTLYITNKKYKFNLSKINTQVQELNNLLKNYSYLNKIKFIDLNNALSTNQQLKDAYTYDGIHLNKKGYKVWSKAIMPYIY